MAASPTSAYIPPAAGFIAWVIELTEKYLALGGILPGTLPLEHPKRGGWKGAKKSRRNHRSREIWLQQKRESRPKQTWVADSPLSGRWEHSAA